jgi:hypothetical protein
MPVPSSNEPGAKSGGARPGARRGHLDRHTQVAEDALDHRGLVDQRNQPETPTAPRTRQGIDAETATHDVNPTWRRRAPTAFRWRGSCVGLGGAGLGEARGLLGRWRVGGVGLVRLGGVPDTHHERPPRGSRPQDAVIQDQVDARPRDQDGVALQEFDGIEHEVRRTIRPRMPEPQDDLPLRVEVEPVLRNRWPQGVPIEPFETLSIVGGDPHARVEVEPILPSVTVHPRGGRVLSRRRATSQDGPARPGAQRKVPCTDAAARPAVPACPPLGYPGREHPPSSSPSPRRSGRRLTRGTMVASTSATSRSCRTGWAKSGRPHHLSQRPHRRRARACGR